MSLDGNAELLQQARALKKDTSGFQRITSLFDADSFHEIDALSKSGGGDAEAVSGYGTVEGCPVYAFAQNSDVEGGAMSKAQAAKISRVFSLAVKTGAPVVGIYDSIGGRLSEEGDLLAAYGEILLHSNNLSGVVPQISVILGPCTGTSALIASGADIIVMSDKSELTIATNGEGGSPEEAAKLGLCHIRTEDGAGAIAAARRLIALLPSNNLSGTALSGAQPAKGDGTLTARAGTGEILSALCDADSFLELGGSFGAPTVTGLAQIGGSTAGVVALSGTVGADAATKAARFVRFCDAFSIPIVTFVNAEQFETLREAVKLSSAYSEATAAKVTVITGSAYGPVYIAVAGRGANADETVAWPDAVVSPLAPETAAVFLWNHRLSGSEHPVEDRKKLVEEYKKTKASSFAAAADGFIGDVILPQETRSRVIAALEMLSSKRVSGLPKKHSSIQI